jgi:smad nuclear-interacting protein 1
MRRRSRSMDDDDGRERRRRREDSRDGGGRDGERYYHRGGERARRERRSRSREREDGAPASTTLAERLRSDGDGGRYGVADAEDVPAPVIPKEEASFALSGLLAAESNSVKGVALKYIEPRGEAKLPTQKWRLYCFKGKEECEEPYKISGQTRYLIGRDRAVVDIPSDHPSCSKQHCVIQFRDVDDGEGAQPYAFDLGSTNGTFVNKKRIDANAYVKLKAKDTLSFGHSTRLYVLLHEGVVS